MSSFSTDPVQNAINGDIKEGIRLALKHECYGSAVTLIFAAMDTMAYVGMPATQEDVKRSDFEAWANRYIQLPGREQIAGLEYYGARCAMLHNHGAESKLSREGKVRIIGYMDKAIPAVRSSPEEPTMVLVSITALAEALFTGIDRFLVDVFADPVRRPVAEKRMQDNMVCKLPFSPGTE
jgi:hypothetical protein